MIVIKWINVYCCYKKLILCVFKKHDNGLYIRWWFLLIQPFFENWQLDTIVWMMIPQLHTLQKARGPWENTTFHSFLDTIIPNTIQIMNNWYFNVVKAFIRYVVFLVAPSYEFLSSYPQNPCHISVLPRTEQCNPQEKRKKSFCFLKHGSL